MRILKDRTSLLENVPFRVTAYFDIIPGIEVTAFEDSCHTVSFEEDGCPFDITKDKKPL
jgi:hypothetical protein